MRMETDFIAFVATLRLMLSPLDVIFAGTFAYIAILLIKKIVKYKSG